MIEVMLLEHDTEALVRPFTTEDPHSVGKIVLRQEMRDPAGGGERYAVGFVDIEFTEPDVRSTGVALFPEKDLPFTPDHLNDEAAKRYISFGYYLAFQREI